MGLPRGQRLRSGGRIREVLRRGRSAVGAVGSLHVLPASAGQGVRLCVTCSRAFGSAVRRNRQRRRVQEACRRLLSPCGGDWDLVFRARPAVAEYSLPALEAALRGLLVRLGVVE